ncbi:MAG: DUF6049 family protein [Rhodoglobus sp.]
MLAERNSRVGPRHFRPAYALVALLLAISGTAFGVSAAANADADSPVKVAIIVPLVVPHSDTGLLTADDLVQYTSPLGLLTRQLDAVIDRPVALAIDPMIIVSIRALGAAAPLTATDWLDRLAAASNQTFALAYSDTDLTLATQAGAPIIPAPQSFDFALDAANFAPASAATATPAPTAPPTTSTPPAWPSTQTLLDWPYSLSGIAWPGEDTVVTKDLKPLAASGYTTAILSSSNVNREAGAGASVKVGDEGVLVSDAPVSVALRSAARAVSDDEWNSAMVVLRAAIQAAGASQPAGATVLGTFDREVPFTGGRLSETVSALATTSDVLDVPISSVIAGPATKATISEKPQPDDRVLLATRVLAAERSEQLFASVAKSPLAVTAPRRLEVLSLFGNQWQSNLVAWPAAAEDFLAASKDLTSSVSVVAGSRINLLADRATLPIAVTNKLDQAVTVYITIEPDTALLAVESSAIKLVIEPNSQGKGQVPVQAISNGRVGITISLASASGVAIGSPTRASINVQAGWETPVVVVLAALVVGTFAAGIVRVIFRRRRESARGNDE